MNPTHVVDDDEPTHPGPPKVDPEERLHEAQREADEGSHGMTGGFERPADAPFER
jgi:hypothetical protein